VNLPLLLVALGIVIAFLVSWALGVVLILVGLALLVFQSGGVRL
jgi:hypothetical protein